MKSYIWAASFLALACGAPIASVAAESTTFEQALAQAYQTNPTLKAERAKLRETDEQVSQALSNWRPDIEATANIGQTYQSINDSPSAAIPSSSSQLTPRSAGIQITQPLFRGFRTVSATNAAEKQVAAERANLLSVEQKLILDAGTAYLDVVHDQAQVELDRSSEDILRHELDVTNERLKAGDAGTTDLHQAESRLKRAEAERIRAEGNLLNHRATYARLMGFPPGTLEAPHLELNSLKGLEAALNLARDHNPDIQAAANSVDEAKEEVDINKGSLLPEVDLVGTTQRQWDQSTFIPGREDTSQILVQVSIPLYKTGADYSKTRAAQQRVTERRMQLEEVRHETYEKTTSAWQSLITAQGSLAANESVRDASDLAQQNVIEEAKAGTRTTLDVLNAEQEFIDAKNGIIQAQHDIGVAILQIRAVTGQLTAENLKLPVDLYDPDRNYQVVRGEWVGFTDADEDQKETAK